MSYPRYHVHAVVGREATLRLAAADAPGAVVQPLRFGLALIQVTDEVALGLGERGEPPYVEFAQLSAAVAAWAREASRKGPVAYLEAEQSDGAGWHAAIVWTDGQASLGPRHAEDAGPINAALRLFGVTASGGQDEFGTLAIAALC